MTDTTRWKNVSLPKDIHFKLDKLRKTIVPDAVISISKTVCILVNKEVKEQNGKLK